MYPSSIYLLTNSIFPSSTGYLAINIAETRWELMSSSRGSENGVSVIIHHEILCIAWRILCDWWQILFLDLNGNYEIFGQL